MIDEKVLLENIERLGGVVSNFRPDVSHVCVNLLCELKDFINEQPKIENSLGFKHFKLYADSTLKSMTKYELISYIHMLHHNWSCADVCAENVMNYVKEIQKENEWIPVEERLPDTADDVLITYQEADLELDDGTISHSDPFIDMARYINGKWFVVDDDRLFDEKILAWQPLSKPYGKK